MALNKPIKEMTKEELLTVAMARNIHSYAASHELYRRTEVYKSFNRTLHPKIANKEYEIAINEIYGNIKEDYRG